MRKLQEKTQKASCAAACPSNLTPRARLKKRTPETNSEIIDKTFGFVSGRFRSLYARGSNRKCVSQVRGGLKLRRKFTPPVAACSVTTFRTASPSNEATTSSTCTYDKLARIGIDAFALSTEKTPCPPRRSCAHLEKV
jgi:hypothetical protein